MKHIIPTLLVALLLPLAALAAETQTVNATGYGTTVDEAKKAAVRSAVEAVVGTMVDAETLVENDEIVEDKILSYSAGLVEDVKVVGEPKKTGDGLFKVRVQAKVKKTALVERIKTATKSEAEVSGESLYLRMTAAKRNLDDAEAVMKKLFDPDRIGLLLKAAPDPGETGSALILDDATGEVTVNVKVWVDMAAYRTYVDELLEKLAPMATEKKDLLPPHGFKEWIESKPDDYFGISRLFDGDMHFYCLVSLRSCKGVALSFDKDKLERLWKFFYAPPEPTLKVALLDKTGEEIAVKTLDGGLEHGGTSVLYAGGGYRQKDEIKKMSVFPFVECHRSFWDSELRTSTYESGTLQVPFGVMKAEDLRDVDRISVEIGVVHDN